MPLSTRVLLVAPSRDLAGELAVTLTSAGYAPIVVGDFVAARTVLETQPDLLITELKLGAYNGLHLAIHAASQFTPAIVIGDADPVLQAEAQRHKAVFLKVPFDPQDVLAILREMPNAVQQKRRFPRKRVDVPDAFANDVQARVLDVSYEGICIEATQEALAALPSRFTMRLPLFNFSCLVQIVWIGPPGGGGAPGAACGAEISTTDDHTATAWRTLVDSLPGAALIA